MKIKTVNQKVSQTMQEFPEEKKCSEKYFYITWTIHWEVKNSDQKVIIRMIKLFFTLNYFDWKVIEILSNCCEKMKKSSTARHSSLTYFERKHKKYILHLICQYKRSKNNNKKSKEKFDETLDWMLIKAIPFDYLYFSKKFWINSRIFL